jgi:hypothetical protein
MSEQAILRARLSKIEALLARPGHEGERLAAEAAAERISDRLAQLRHERPLSGSLFPPRRFWNAGLLDIVESQRVAAYTLCRSNLAWAYDVTSFMRAAAWPQSETVTRFWYGDHPAR